MVRPLIWALIMFVGGCAVQRPAPASSPSERQPAPSSGPFSVPEPVVKPAPQRESVAVASMVESARADAASGRLANAAASVERALRIEPRNPRLWNELARIRLRQRDYAQAEATAARSNSFAGSDSGLRASNADVIAQARRAMGR